MVNTQPTTYAGFKQVVSELGGSKKTPVLANEQPDSSFQVAAVFGAEMIVVNFVATSKPATFDDDFPQAVYTDAAVGAGS